MSAPATLPWKGLDAFFVASAGETLCSLLRPANGFKECAGPKTAANDELSNPVFDIEQPVDELDGRRLLQKYRGLNWRRRKHSPPSNTQTRRVEVVLPTLTESLTPVPNERTGRNAFRFQKVSFRNICQLPDAANDNDLPREVEAA